MDAVHQTKSRIVKKVEYILHLKKNSMLRNSASGPEIGLPGRIQAGFYSGASKSALRPAFGRLEGRF